MRKLGFGLLLLLLSTHLSAADATPAAAAQSPKEAAAEIASLKQENTRLQDQLQKLEEALTKLDLKMAIPSDDNRREMAEMRAILDAKSAEIGELQQLLAAAKQQAMPASTRASEPSGNPPGPDPFGAPPSSCPNIPGLPAETPNTATTNGEPKAPLGVPERVKGQHDSYADWVDQFRMRAYEAQFIESRLVFGLVMFIVLCGLGFSGYHLYWTQHLRNRRGKDAPDPDASAAHSLKFGKDGVELSSPVLGLMILGLSVLFLFLYLRFVYPITVVSG